MEHKHKKGGKRHQNDINRMTKLIEIHTIGRTPQYEIHTPLRDIALAMGESSANIHNFLNRMVEANVIVVLRNADATRKGQTIFINPEAFEQFKYRVKSINEVRGKRIKSNNFEEMIKRVQYQANNINQSSNAQITLND